MNYEIEFKMIEIKDLSKIQKRKMVKKQKIYKISLMLCMIQSRIMMYSSTLHYKERIG